MRKIILVAIVAVIVTIIAVSALAMVASLNTKQRDTSWVGSVNQMLENYSSYPNGTEQSNPNVLASYCRVYLYENGTSGLIEFGDLGSNQTLSLYLNNLLNETNVQLNPISEGSLNNALANDKIVEIVYRGGTQMFGGQQQFSVGYFVLNDTANQGLTGTIITQEVGSSNYSVWEIAK